MKRFPSDEVLVRDIIAYFSLHKREISPPDFKFIADHGRHARMMLMGMISSVEFGNESWFKIMNAEDPAVQKALEVIKDDRKITLKY
jgi:hypothetical protein